MAAPDQFVFDLTYLRELELKFLTVSDAEAELRTTEEEEKNALKNVEAAGETLSGLPEETGDVPDIQKILDLRNASRIVTEATKATEALRLVQQSARTALSPLSLDLKRFESVPELPLSSEDASTLARDIEFAKGAVSRTEDEFAGAEEAAEADGSVFIWKH